MKWESTHQVSKFTNVQLKVKCSEIEMHLHNSPSPGEHTLCSDQQIEGEESDFLWAMWEEQRMSWSSARSVEEEGFSAGRAQAWKEGLCRCGWMSRHIEKVLMCPPSLYISHISQHFTPLPLSSLLRIVMFTRHLLFKQLPACIALPFSVDKTISLATLPSTATVRGELRDRKKSALLYQPHFCQHKGYLADYGFKLRPFLL